MELSFKQDETAIQGETVVQDGNETDKIMRYVTPRNTLFIVQMAERGK